MYRTIAAQRTSARRFATALVSPQSRQKISFMMYRWDQLCRKKPYLVAGRSSCFFLVVGDIMAQSLTAPPEAEWDVRRSIAMASWGLLWYGGPQQYFWVRLYPRVIGRGTPKLALTTAFADSVVNQMVAYVPCFYMLTGIIKGQTLAESFEQLKREYWSACLGQASFWAPLQYMNFRYVPIHRQTFVVSIANVVNKTWLSWLSNRQRVAEQEMQSGAKIAEAI
jgi:hypothetical protein